MPISVSAIRSGDYTLDPAHTRLGFVARHAMVTKVRGAFNDFEGSAHVDAENVKESYARVTIRAASIDTRNAQRDEHLRSNDFLAMEQYPEITFVSTAVEATGENAFDLTGDLTVKGVTNTVTVPFTYEGTVTDPYGNERVGFDGSTTINRKDYGVTWNAVLDGGGVMVSETITLEFEISAVRNAS